MAWDEGASEVARSCARRLGCPLHLGRWTRLVADLNRSPRHRKVVPEVAGGVPVPGNAGLSREERDERLRRYHAPWRAKVEHDVERAVARDGWCVHLSFHSFTPVLGESVRRTDVGILYDASRPAERAFADVLHGALAGTSRIVHRNQPYRGTADGLTTWLRRKRFDPSQYVGLELEVSHRLMRDRSDFRRLVREMTGALARTVAAYELPAAALASTRRARARRA